MRVKPPLIERYYDSVAVAYKRKDERRTPIERAFFHALFDGVSESFDPSNATALELGCGAGRNFHYLRRVGRLDAIDLSTRMLAEAARPVHSEEIEVGTIRLVRGDATDETLWSPPYDLIYSLGTITFCVPLNARLLQAVHAALREGGYFVCSLYERSRWHRYPRAILGSALHRIAPRSRRPAIGHATLMNKCAISSEARVLKQAARIGLQVAGLYNHPNKCHWKLAVMQRR